MVTGYHEPFDIGWLLQLLTNTANGEICLKPSMID